ncbi:MAG: hypothetical protein Q8831_01855 ['Bonamia sp.' little leaf phytoplasma]|uniref:Uncharacterized protein n=1 Tax=Candidatus Phytoplasma bonamiae TaxID=2982626 RepID=A0ABT9D976_9MOLU|nr:hypothetical protein ['Bonamia sp.' little leaf phytoplasma]MDV3174778.1 hypothetical protein ['Bonamia sp.' little leaf phytoplasma]
MFLDKYYEEEKLGNKNIFLLPKSTLNKIIILVIIQKKVMKKKTNFNFFKIIGFT